jgi:F-type H+-transporting ATPase subunit beta
VRLADTVKSFRAMLNGDYDDLPEQAFLMCGAIDTVLEKAKALGY